MLDGGGEGGLEERLDLLLAAVEPVPYVAERPAVVGSVGGVVDPAAEPAGDAFDLEGGGHSGGGGGELSAGVLVGAGGFGALEGRGDGGDDGGADCAGGGPDGGGEGPVVEGDVEAAVEDGEEGGELEAVEGFVGVEGGEGGGAADAGLGLGLDRKSVV